MEAMTKCPACQSDLVTIMELGEFAQNETISSYNAICGKCSNRFVEMVYDGDMEDVNKSLAQNKTKIYTEEEINELAARCEGHTADGAVTEANLHLEIAAPSLLDTCQALLRERKALVAALKPFASIGDRSVYPPHVKRLDVHIEWCERARAALAQVQDGGGK